MEYAADASSKAAVAQLIRVLAREWVPNNILINAIGEELIGTILLLLKKGGAFITGQTIYVDGGRTLV
jgi:NAD(P)-dependent dehydrogenase (short-subunit alcohol dehydrogenase family)